MPHQYPSRRPAATQHEPSSVRPAEAAQAREHQPVEESEQPLKQANGSGLSIETLVKVKFTGVWSWNPKRLTSRFIRWLTVWLL